MNMSTDRTGRGWIPRAKLCLLTLSVSFAVFGCADSSTSDTLIVSVASSLADAFEDIKKAFETQNPSIDVELNVGGSSSLREQIRGGAPVDVFAGADPQIAAEVVAATEADSEVFIFATNSMIIGVPDENPGGVANIGDLSRPELLVGLCAEAVPCGAYATRVLENAGVEPAVDTREPDVRSLVLKLSVGELDAGIVYLTDTRDGRSDILGIEIPEASNVTAEYPIVAISDSDTAVDFVAFVVSEPGQRILADHGFGSP